MLTVVPFLTDVEVGVPGRDQPVAIGKVRFKKSAYLAEFEYVKSLLPDHLWGEIKMTMPSPSWSHTQLKDGKAFTPEAYTDDEEYLKDIGKAMRQEILALYDAGWCVMLPSSSRQTELTNTVVSCRLTTRCSR